MAMSFDKTKRIGAQKPRTRHRNSHIPGIFEMMGSPRENRGGKSDMPKNTLFLPMGPKPKMKDTSRMAKRWAQS